MYYITWAIIILIFIWRIVSGFRKGLVQEIISLIAMVVAGFCIVLILSAISSYMEAQIGEVIQMTIVLFVVCLVYKFVNVLFTSLKLISKIPIIKGFNAILGGVIGAVEAVVIIVLLVYIIKNTSLSLLSIGGFQRGI